MTLECMLSTPVAVLLSVANEPPLALRHTLLANRFILRNVSWRGSPLIPRLRLLSERSNRRGFRINPSRCGLLIAYEGVRGVSSVCFRIQMFMQNGEYTAF